MREKSTVKYNKEYRLYYQKNQLEGEPHFLKINKVMSKSLRTIYNVVNSKMPYSRDYIYLDSRKINKNVNGYEEIVAKNL